MARKCNSHKLFANAFISLHLEVKNIVAVAVIFWGTGVWTPFIKSQETRGFLRTSGMWTPQEAAEPNAIGLIGPL